MDDSTEFPPREAKTFLPFKFPGPSQSLILYTYPCLLHLNFPSSCALRLSRCSFSKLSQHLTYIFRWPSSKENLTLMYHRFLYFLLSHICHSYHKSTFSPVNSSSITSHLPSDPNYGNTKRHFLMTSKNSKWSF